MDHILTILPGLPGATTVSGKCSCQARWNGKTGAELQRRYQDHLHDLGHETPEETERRDNALEATTRENRAQAERDVAAGDLSTPLDVVEAELDVTFDLPDGPGHRQNWDARDLAIIETWAATHRIARDIEDPTKSEAFRDLLDDLWDARLIAGS